MSDTNIETTPDSTETSVVQEELGVLVDPRNLQGIELPNMMWMFCAYTEDAAFDIMEEYPDLSAFYLLGADEKDDDDTRLYKVQRTLMGWAINAIGAAPKMFSGLAKIETGARYKFPAIPSALVEKVDSFFRKVAQDLHTEAIVLLTIDPATLEWGVLVPKQSNSAAHCDYDHLAAHEERPDHVIWAGTMHSHPGMSAYASGVDHHDQETFDGVHITFGYPHNRAETEFHAEMQLGDKYTLKLEHVFETVAPELDFPELEEWSERVSKAVPTHGTTGTRTGTTGGAGTSGYNQSYPNFYQGGTTSSSTAPARRASGNLPMLDILDKREARPHGCPNPNEHIIVVDLEPGEVVCPVCKDDLDSYGRSDMKCWKCATFFLDDDVKTLEDLVRYRKKMGRMVTEIDYTATPPPQLPIMRWVRKTDDKGVLLAASYAEPLWKPNTTGGGTRFFG